MESIGSRAWCCLPALLIGSACFSSAAAGGYVPFTLTNILPAQYRAQPTYSDYNNDGIDDITLWTGPGLFQLASGANGQILRTWSDPYGQAGNLGLPSIAIDDIDNNGKNDFLVAQPGYTSANGVGAYVAISSASPGGDVNSIPLLYRITHPGGYSGYFAYSTVDADSARSAIGLGDDGRAVIVDNATGVIRARLFRSSAAYQGGFGHAVGAIGDINGDGIDDFAIGDPNVLHSSPFRRGEIYLIDGAATTAGTSYVAVDSFPGRIATIQPSLDMSLGAGLGPTFVNLGDPIPGNNVREQLFVAGTPYNSASAGGFAAFLMIPSANGMNFTEVANHTSNVRGNFGGNTINLGDVNGDGVGDVAFLESGDGSHVQRGQVMIVSGAGLLDGFQLSVDVLQQITDPAYTFSDNLRFLGDYNHDGFVDFLVTASGPSGQVRIYSAIPEPAFAIVSALTIPAAMWSQRRRRRED